MSVPKHWLLCGSYPWELIVHLSWYRSSDNNKNLDKTDKGKSEIK